MRSAIVLALAAALALGGCAGRTAAPSPDAAPSAPVEEPAAPDETPGGPRPAPGPPPSTAAEVRERGAPQVRLEGVTVHYTDGIGQVSVEGSADGEHWTFTPATDRPVDAIALIAAPEGAEFQVLADGSVVVPPVPGVTNGIGVAPLAEGTYALPAPDLLALRARAGAPGDPVELSFGLLAVEEATWGQNEGGRSLAVVPTPWARGAGLAGAELAWWHVEWFAPDEATPGMRDQLVCHAVGAPDKASWNLEPWRPDVGPALTLLAECNPT